MNGGRPENRDIILIPPATVIPLQMISQITIRLDELAVFHFRPTNYLESFLIKNKY